MKTAVILITTLLAGCSLGLPKAGDVYEDLVDETRIVLVDMYAAEGEDTERGFAFWLIDLSNIKARCEGCVDVVEDCSTNTAPCYIFENTSGPRTLRYYLDPEAIEQRLMRISP